MKTCCSSPAPGLLLLLLLLLDITVLQTAASAASDQGFCPSMRTLTTRSNCFSCRISSSFLFNCPTGFRERPWSRAQDCMMSSITSGCSYECYREVKENRCCPGHWGPDCIECPETAERPCSSNGVCSEGMGGNGTCSCKDGFAGTACEDCAPNRYGPNCGSECTCVHGLCNSGLLHDGKCTCFSGYKGDNCDQELPECASLGCQGNAACREEAMSGQLVCQCAVGYRRSGEDCVSVNPCLQKPCHAKATCSHTGPNKYICACADGYAGDGHVCLAVDPCQTDQAGCSAQTTKCVYDGPGASHCECLPGFHQLDNRLSCRLQDVCKPDSCHEKANCSTVQPGVTECTCPEGYLGDGKVCYGNIMQRMRDLNTEPGGQWTGQLTSAITFFDSLSWALQTLGPFTVFVPINSGFRFTSVKTLMADPLKAKYLCKLHMAAGTMPQDDLKRADVYYTLTGKAGEVDTSGFDTRTKIRLRGSKKKVTIVKADIMASNGMIHLVSKYMDNMAPTVDSDMQENLLKVISDYGKFSKFKSLLEKADLASLMDSPGPFTVFAPTNNAFSAMPEGHLQYLTSAEGHSKLLGLVRNHIVASARLEVYSVVSSPGVASMANDVLLFNVSQTGRVLVSGVAVLEADVAARNGQLYSLDGVLVPASIQPVLPHRCDVPEVKVVKGECMSCTKATKCSSGLYVGVTHGCYYILTLTQSNVKLPILGCNPLCNTTVQSPACCQGFYGDDCLPCPGGFQTPCSGHGQCMEGMQGNGTCVCKSGFRGSRCQYCSQPNKYGPNCDRTCPCIHGVCDNRPDADGRCKPNSCQARYTGTHCERHTQACGPQIRFCHAHADCDFTQGIAQCVCKPAYQGDGIMCVERDPCALPSRGGCGKNAKCIKTGANAHVCQCLVGWTMDGDECRPINDCNSPGRGGCHGNASCIYIGPGQSDCMCKPGYQGNGISCEPTNLCVVQNGQGCHFNAKCQLVSGRWGCVCEDGYVGDGEVCSGTVQQELITLPDASDFLTWVTDAGLSQSLSDQNITLLVPTADAIKNLAEDDKSFWTSQGNLPSLVRNHVILGKYPLSSFTASTTMVTSLLNTSLAVAMTASSAVTIGGATITVANVAATNGLIHTIDKVLVPDRTRSEGLLEVLALRPEFSLFRSFLIQHNLTEEIEQAKEYTVFAPINAAVKDYLRTTSADVMDVNTTRYHVLLSKRLLKTDLQAGGYRQTMLGFSYQLAIFPRDGKLLVNSAQMNVSNILTGKGAVHGLSSVLEINRNRCDKAYYLETMGSCRECNTPLCPRGTVPKANAQKRRCMKHRVFDGQAMLSIGCRIPCMTTVIIRRCCGGFFGKHCQPCPRFDGQSCAGHGSCSDGTNGTGVCSCHPNFSGTACESCVAGKYGVHCDQDCGCMRGRCSDGPLGDGTCECDVGWKGILCDEKIESSAEELCGAVKCHTSANCITKRSQTQCACAAGFEGNGTDCKARDPCRVGNGGCSPDAVCKRTQPGRRDCVCRSGFSGDGRVCVEINACLEGTGRCHENADCIHSGPNKTLCTCRQGYWGNGQKCKMTDLCLKKNGDCHQFAKCNTTGPGVRTCTCQAGYVGDGVSCKGTVGKELLTKNRVDFYMVALISYGLPLNGRGPFTIFTTSRWTSAQVKSLKILAMTGHMDLVGNIIQSHVVMCHTLTASDLAVPRNLTALSGMVLTTRMSQGTIFINDAKVTFSDDVSVNGIIHEIDTFLVSPSLENLTLSSSRLNLSDVAERHGYQSFYKLLEETGVMGALSDAANRPATLFLPSDRALSSLSRQQRDFLYDPHNKEQLLEYVRYHVVPHSKVYAAELVHLDGARTLQGAPLQFSCGGSDAIGDIFINGGKCRIIQRHLDFTGGIAYGIDCLLTPPSIGSRCDEHKSVELVMKCASCNLPSNPCPSGSELKASEKCDLPLLSVTKHSGCRHTCLFNQWQPKCCAGYYGRDCQACPGGAGSVCSNHGDCDDGHLGNGTCKCHDGFQGVACELCDAGRYGPACDACRCTPRGACVDGRRGSGECFCEVGWTGERCEIQQAAVPVCSPPCAPQAVCQDNNTCVCRPYYEGNGSTCALVDRCAAGHGGCAPGSRCVQKETAVSCVCPSGHQGDGVSCQPSDPCALRDNGGCHEHATCTMTGPGKSKCACKDNFVGDGVTCAVKELPINRCLHDNGLCHADATCTDLHFEDAKVGVFHVRSDQGVYKLTYASAVAACTERGAAVATYTQLSYAQQAGYNLCAAGWLDNARVSYPTTYSNPSCGFGHVGLVDYGVRKNLSETWDTFCYRVKVVACACKPGYVGDGYACTGNLLQVLISRPLFSNFLTQILNCSQRSASGKRFVERLTDLSSKSTLFVPDNTGLLDNQTLSERDVEYHLAEGQALALSDMKNGGKMGTRHGSLSIQGVVDFLDPTVLSSFYVNDRFIIDSDILAANGVIHVLQGPLKAPPAPQVLHRPGQKAGLGVGLLLLLVLLPAILFVGYRFHAHKTKPFQFSYFKDEGEEEDSTPTPPHSNFSNPFYAPPAEPSPPGPAAEDAQPVANVSFDLLQD